MGSMELELKSRERQALILNRREIESLRFLLYRVLGEAGTPPDTRELRERILSKLEAR